MSEAARHMSQLFAGWEDQPGCAAVVLRGGDIVWQGCFGLASLEHRVPITTATRFRIGSISKQFCAALLVVLDDEGLVSLGEEVRTYLPELCAFDPPVTLRHLLDMTGGIREELDLLALATGDHQRGPANRRDLHDLVVRQSTQNFPTGASMLYSNSAYSLAQEIAERVTGRPLAELLWERIFDPLGMAATSFESRPDVVLPGFASGYVKDGDGFAHGVWAREGTAAGGIVSTLDDMMRWQLNLRANRLGPADLVRRMIDVPTLSGGQPSCYGLGLYVQPYRGLKSVGHAGGLPGWGCDQLWFPDQDLAVLALGNRDDVSWMARTRAIAERCLEPDLTEAARRGGRLAWGRPQELDDGEPERFCGVYGNSAVGRCHIVSLREGRLALDRLMLDRAGPMRFETLFSDALPKDVEFVTGGDGVATAIRVGAPAGRPETFERCEPRRPSPRETESLLGEYAGDDFPGRISVREEDGELRLSVETGWPDRPALYLRVVQPDLLLMLRDIEDYSGGWHARVAREENGAVKGLEITTGRTVRYPLERRDA